MHDTRKIENLHVSLWLLKDVSWCSEWHALGLFMIFPTLLVALKICWDTRRSLSDLVHNIAVALWICANTVWMIGEFYFQDGTRPFARVFFYAGMVLLASYYTWEWFHRRRAPNQPREI
ncbi:MAG: hypothetical protein WDO18_23225 [Acidobacteriota bacterium]